MVDGSTTYFGVIELIEELNGNCMYLAVARTDSPGKTAHLAIDKERAKKLEVDTLIRYSLQQKRVLGNCLVENIWTLGQLEKVRVKWREEKGD